MREGRHMDKKIKKAIAEVVQILFGTGLFGLAVNQLILPFGLYNTGFLGIAQVIVSILTDVTRIYRGSFDLVSPIFLMINIPAFLLGLFLMGKKFMVKTIFATIMYSVWMMILSAPEHAIVSDPLTACLLGGILTGIGVGIVLTTGAAGGGQDIVGMCITERNPKASVGIMYIIINLFVYGCCYFIYDMERVIYSLIYTTLMALVLDRCHKRNILVGVMVFTKKENVSIGIMENVHRGVTRWDGMGCYTDEETKVYYSVANKYELPALKQEIHKIDPDAFIVCTENVQVDGKFAKRLSD